MQMATIFETRLIGNIGKDATIKSMERGIVAINFPVAHNKNWRDKKSGEQRTKTTWVNCTIWKREGANMRIADFLKKGTLIEISGEPFAKAYIEEDGSARAEIRLNVFKTNILKTPQLANGEENADFGEDFDNSLSDFSIDEDDF